MKTNLVFAILLVLTGYIVLPCVGDFDYGVFRQGAIDGQDYTNQSHLGTPLLYQTLFWTGYFDYYTGFRIYQLVLSCCYVLAIMLLLAMVKESDRWILMLVLLVGPMIRAEQVCPNIPPIQLLFWCLIIKYIDKHPEWCYFLIGASTAWKPNYALVPIALIIKCLAERKGHWWFMVVGGIDAIVVSMMLHPSAYAIWVDWARHLGQINNLRHLDNNISLDTISPLFKWVAVGLMVLYIIRQKPRDQDTSLIGLTLSAAVLPLSWIGYSLPTYIAVAKMPRKHMVIYMAMAAAVTIAISIFHASPRIIIILNLFVIYQIGLRAFLL